MNLPNWIDWKQVPETPTGTFPEFDAFVQDIVTSMEYGFTLHPRIHRAVRAGCLVALRYGPNSVHIIDSIVNELSGEGVFPPALALTHALDTACEACVMVPEPGFPMPTHVPTVYPWLLGIAKAVSKAQLKPDNCLIDWDATMQLIQAGLSEATIQFTVALMGDSR